MERIKNGKVFIWMQLLGFDRNDPDLGADRYLAQAGFVPDGICALLWHPDFIHQHRGMAEEYGLSAANCAYFGIPRNRERERQPWTNHDFRALIQNLARRGVGMYAGVMGSDIGDVFHQEWVSGHPEVKRHYRDGYRGNHHLLKHFSDGSLYEDFFIQKVCEVLTDYGFRGVHLADFLSPCEKLYRGDYSTDMVAQFISGTGAALPPAMAAALGDDSPETENARGDWIWENLRVQWIEFMCGRWEQFFAKLCSRVHAIGCEVMTMGMYCTDPFETKYCLGLDLARIMKAGVDYLTANILPTSCYLSNSWGSAEYFFHRYNAIAPVTAAHIRDGSLVTMAGLQDATEEWDMMKHAPCLHERDLYTAMAYCLADKQGVRRASKGYFLCLGDGIQRADWDIERGKLETALSADVDSILSPSMLWSETAYEKMTAEYMRTRRWTPFKLFYEMGKAGVMCGACVRADALEHYSGTLLVPNFDMLSDDEKRRVAQYKNGGGVCTAPAGFDPAQYGIQPTVHITDRFSKHPLSAFAFGAPVSRKAADKIGELLARGDGGPDPDAADILDDDSSILVDTLPFVKVSAGFRDAVALLLKEIQGGIIACDMPYMAFRLKNGAWRLYLYNNVNHQYRHAFVQMNRPAADVRIVSGFPVLPVRFIDQKSGNLIYFDTGKPVSKRNFEVKLQPGGVTVLDVFMQS
ncbi:MAG: hypothetical protein FWE62_03265 [Firmicutes bacterium]|nr:hypothetical protein [Bacillota bacterium]